MKPEANFIAEGVAAQHCPELLRSPKPPVDPVEVLAPFGIRIAELLEEQLPALFGDVKLRVSVGEAAKLQPGTPADKTEEPLVASQLAIGPRELGLAVSLPQDAVHSIVDIAFGGNGGKQESMAGRKLPLSALLTYQRFETLVAKVLASVFGPAEEGVVKIRETASGTGAQVPYAGCNRAVLPIEIALDGIDPWPLQLTFPPVTLQVLCAGKARARPATPPAPFTAATLPTDMADIPLPLTALLVDMDVPVSLLAQLTPGMVLPVAIARRVPLCAGERILAHGHIGEADDRAALKLSGTVSGNSNSNREN